MTVQTLIREKTYTIEEYFKMEEKANQKSEFRNGKIVAMPGGTFNHAKIGGNIFANLYATLDEDYDVISSDYAIHLPEFNHIVYSDTCVIKGEPEFHNKNTRAILNPVLIFEVASESTEKYDRYTKFKKYKTLPSFEEYVLVSQDMPIVEVYLKVGENWQSKTYIGLEEIVELHSIDAKLKMQDIYKKVNDLLDPQLLIDWEK